jgi:hypothetical protein
MTDQAQHTLRLTCVLQQRRGGTIGRRPMLSGQLGIAQVSLRRRDFTSSALDETIHACLLRMLRALANLLLT